MTSRQRPRKWPRWPLGTKIRKYFFDHGDLDGEVKGYKDGLYSIEYVDGDKEQFDEREMERYILKTPSQEMMITDEEDEEDELNKRMIQEIEAKIVG